jgi:hypothetical protein
MNPSLKVAILEQIRWMPVSLKSAMALRNGSG